MKITVSAFAIGFGFSSVTRMLIEDYIGQQGMINLIRDHWVDASIGVPFALSMIVILSYLFFSLVKIEKCQNKLVDKSIESVIRSVGIIAEHKTKIIELISIIELFKKEKSDDHINQTSH